MITSKDLADAYEAAMIGEALPQMAVTSGRVLNALLGDDRYDPTLAYIVRRLDDGTAVIIPVDEE